MNQIPSNNNIPVAIDLRDFYISTEWDVMAVPAVRNEKFYTCCEVGFPISYRPRVVELRRGRISSFIQAKGRKAAMM